MTLTTLELDRILEANANDCPACFTRYRALSYAISDLRRAARAAAKRPTEANIRALKKRTAERDSARAEALRHFNAEHPTGGAA